MPSPTCLKEEEGNRVYCLNLTEQLGEDSDSDEVVVVLTSQHPRDKRSPFDEGFHSMRTSSDRCEILLSPSSPSAHLVEGRDNETK